MIKVYHLIKIDNKTERVELGFTFQFFNKAYFGNDLAIHPSYPAARAYFKGSKIDVLLFNLETFLLSFINDKADKNPIRINAEERLASCLKWCNDNSDHYMPMLEILAKCESFMLTLVNSVSGSDRIQAIMRYKMLIEFVKQEIAANDDNIPHTA